MEHFEVRTFWGLGRFEAGTFWGWDVLGLGLFGLGHFEAWDVFKLGHFVCGRCAVGLFVLGRFVGVPFCCSVKQEGVMFAITVEGGPRK
jgi:hypothetical protein